MKTATMKTATMKTASLPPQKLEQANKTQRKQQIKTKSS